jgi:hypothetical protein
MAPLLQATRRSTSNCMAQRRVRVVSSITVRNYPSPSASFHSSLSIDDKTSAQPKGAIPFKDATGVCYLHHIQSVNPCTRPRAKKVDTDLKFAIFTPQRVWMLAFSKEDENHGWDLLRRLYGVLNEVELLIKGWIHRKQDGISVPGSMIFWKLHYFA